MIYFGFHLLIDACILADSLFVDSEYIRVTIIIIKSKSDDQGKVSDARPTLSDFKNINLKEETRRNCDIWGFCSKQS